MRQIAFRFNFQNAFAPADFQKVYISMENIAGTAHIERDANKWRQFLIAEPPSGSRILRTLDTSSLHGPEWFHGASICVDLFNEFGTVQLNTLMPNRYNCTYVLLSFLRFNCCKKLILTLLNHKSPKRTILRIEINQLKVNLKINRQIFIFAPSALMG